MQKAQRLSKLVSMGGLYPGHAWEEKVVEYYWWNKT